MRGKRLVSRLGKLDQNSVTIFRFNERRIDVKSIYYDLVWKNKQSTHDFRMKYKNGNGNCQLSEIQVSFQRPLIGPPIIRAAQIKSVQIRADKVQLHTFRGE